jgi:hypothetical protein
MTPYWPWTLICDEIKVIKERTNVYTRKTHKQEAEGGFNYDPETRAKTW